MANEHIAFLDDLATGEISFEWVMDQMPHVMADLPFPDGFVIRPEVLDLFLDTSKDDILEVLSDLSNPEDAAQKIEDIMAGALLPPEAELSIARSFTKLIGDIGWCLVLPPCHDTPHVFAYPVVNDKISLLRTVRETYLELFSAKNINSAKEKMSCPIIILSVGEAETTGTVTIINSNIMVNSSRGWMGLEEHDTHVLSISDGNKLEEHISLQDSLHQLTDKGFVETKLDDGDQKNISEDTLLDLHGLTRKFFDWGKCGQRPFVFSWLQPIGQGKKPRILSFTLQEEEKHPNEVLNIDQEVEAPMPEVDEIVTPMPPSHITQTSTDLPSPTTSPYSPIQSPVEDVLISTDLKLPIQPTATGIISIGGMEPWFPPNVGTWVHNEIEVPAEGVLDAYISIGDEISLLDGILHRIKAGRVFLIVSPHILAEAKRTCDACLPEHRAILLAHITQSSEAFLSEEMAAYANGVMIDTPIEGASAARILSRTAETISRSIGQNKKVVINAREHFWSEEFLHDVISQGTYALAVDMNDVAIASNLVASTERRILLKRGPNGGK